MTDNFAHLGYQRGYQTSQGGSCAICGAYTSSWADCRSKPKRRSWWLWLCDGCWGYPGEALASIAGVLGLDRTRAP